KGRLLHVDENGLIGGFQKRPGSHPWIGEHVGKFLHAAANTYEYTHDEKLKELMDRLAKELIATQLPDGYLGTYTDDQRWRAWDQPDGPKIIDSLLKTGSVYKTANAKAYEMLSNIVGLVDLYRLTGDEKSFKVARIAWDDVAKNRLYISGTASSHEHFQDNG